MLQKSKLNRSAGYRADIVTFADVEAVLIIEVIPRLLSTNDSRALDALERRIARRSEEQAMRWSTPDGTTTKHILLMAGEIVRSS